VPANNRTTSTVLLYVTTLMLQDVLAEPEWDDTGGRGTMEQRLAVGTIVEVLSPRMDECGRCEPNVRAATARTSDESP
jgi:hypothetical protein